MTMPKSKRAGRAARAPRFSSTTALQPQGQAQAVASSFLPRAATMNGFTLRDEARNTAQRHTPWDQSSNLRTRPVIFVSAGLIEPLKELEEPRPGGGRSSGPSDQENDVHGEKTVVQNLHPLQPQREHQNTSQVSTEEPSRVATSAQLLESRQDVAALAVSTEPPLFFWDTAGARGPGLAHPVDIPDCASPDSETDSSEDVVLFKGRSGSHRDATPPGTLDEITIEINAAERTLDHNAKSTRGKRSARKKGSRTLPDMHHLSDEKNEDEAILADYIANIVQTDEDNTDGDGGLGEIPYRSFLAGRDLGGSDNELVMNDKITSRDHNKDSEDVPHDELPVAGETMQDDEDDENFARLLAKQEELGLDENDIAIFSSDFLGTITRHASSGAASKRQTELGTSTKTAKKARSTVLSANDIADAFDDLDLMDWDRHRLPRKPKSQRGQPTFNTSDPELQATLQAAWSKDRLRKKERKKEREELRAQGLLGHGAGPSKLSVKYQTGMTMEQIKEEMRDFLRSSQDSLVFPPMYASARKIIHELANKFRMKSKSMGKADTRRPGIYRTKSTIPYSETYFEQVFSRTGRKHFARLDVKGRPAKKPTGGTGRINHAAFTYRDGEVVGASAPELGQDNKGRTMLEKMGWSSGMALGSLDNQGILQPVAHVVKRSKAGLG